MGHILSRLSSAKILLGSYRCNSEATNCFLGVVQISLILKAVFVLLATQIFIHLHITYEPYTKHNSILHRIEYWSLLVVFFTMCLGLLYSVPDGHCMGGRCFDVFASIFIVCLNLSFTAFCFRLYLTKYLQEHEYFKEQIPPWLWSTCVEMGKCFSGAKTRAWKLCSKASSNLFFNPSDRIKKKKNGCAYSRVNLGVFIIATMQLAQCFGNITILIRAKV